MKIIDADTHVIETEQTWQYMEGDERKLRPLAIQAPSPSGDVKDFWLIDGRLLPRRSNIGVENTTEATREMTDLDARIRHMDQLGVDIQVLYPSILTPTTKRPEVELAMCKSYNRWLVDICTKGKGRFAWVAMLPMMSMDEALKELRWAKQNGACAVFMRGFEGDRRCCDPYFFPLYQAAGDLDIALAFHVALGSIWMTETFASESFSTFKFPVFNTFWSMVSNGIPDRFPELKVGFIEASSQWIPYVMHHLALSASLRKQGKGVDRELMAKSRFYVSCQTDDDLDYVLRYAGEDNLVIGSDYGHADTSTEIEALRNLKAQGKLEPSVVDKILTANPAKFYGL